MTEDDLKNKDKYFSKYLKLSFNDKVKIISKYIDGHMKDLNSIWAELKIEIGQLNRERRFLVHGFTTYYLPKENIKTSVAENGKVVDKKYTLVELKKITTRLHHLKTGNNGIKGEFYTQFRILTENKWNEASKDEIVS